MNNKEINYPLNQDSEHNVTDAIITDSNITFKESFIVVGELLKARNIYANYDLRIMGDVEAESITVLGNLYVFGAIKTKKLSCSQKVTCEGEINSEEIIVDDTILSNNISCKSVMAADIIVRESIDVTAKVEVEGNILAGDGILGHGELTADNTIAINYYDFTGNVEGNIFDLSEVESNIKPEREDISFNSLVDIFAKKTKEQVVCWHQEDDDEFIEKIRDLSSKIPDYNLAAKLADKVIGYTYYTKIDNLYDFLVLFWARNSFPEEVKQYATIKLALDLMYEDAKKRVDTLTFNPGTIEEVVISLYIVISFKQSLPISYEFLLDTIFAKIGPRYQTVLQLIKKN